MPDNVFLSLDHGPFLSLSAIVKAEDGATRGTFRKEVIAVGGYVQEDQGVEFEITLDTLRHWVATFRAMQKNGVKIPILLGHVETAEANRGWMMDLFTEGKSLVMTCELFDKDVENLVRRNDVSLCSPPEWTDGKGNRYVRPIRHIALTPVPVVPGLSDFVPIAASFGDTDMTLDLKQLGADIGIEKELDEKNAGTLILDFCKTLKGQVETATGKVTELGKELETAKKEPKPSAKKVEVDPTLLSLAHDNHTMKLDALVAAAKITPAVRDKLAASFIGKDGAVLKLSLEAGTVSQFDKVVDALKENDPVKLGEQTGAQSTLELSDPNKKGADDDVLVKDAEARAKAAAGS